MDEMPGMIRPDLQALPQVKDRIFSPHMRGVIPKGAGQGRADGSFPRMCGVCEKESRTVPLRMLFYRLQILCGPAL